MKKKKVLISIIVVAAILSLLTCLLIALKPKHSNESYYSTNSNSTSSEVPQTTVPIIHTCNESEWIIDKEATQIEDGIKYTECTYCGKMLQEEFIPATGSKGLKFILTSYDEYKVSNGSCKDSEVIIPSEYNGKPVTIIDSEAFADCNWITSIIILDSVTHIYDKAFELCSNLTNIVIPNSVEYIGWGAFYCCEALKSIVIPSSVTIIENHAFHICYSLTNIEVDQDNQHYKSIDGNLYSKDGKTLIQYSLGKQDTMFTIPDGVTTIAESAISCSPYLTTMVIPNTITDIGDSAFELSESITSFQYDGTMDEWHHIRKGTSWKYGIKKYIVYCTDGIVT